jgi:DNA-binding transcriptional MerR regulator
MPTPDHLTTGTFPNDTRTDEVPDGAHRYTVEELARAVGMSTRNIRAHQTRRLLDPPVRTGRTAYYDGRHLRRLMHIRSLQDQGFNLVAIEAVLAGPAGTEPVGTGPAAVESTSTETDDLRIVLHHVAAGHPRLIHALTRHRVVHRAPDGTVRPVQTRLLRSALGLDRAGLPPALSLQVLAEVLDSLRPVADELGQATSARILALLQRSGRPAVRAAGPVDRDGLHPGLGDLLAEVFRATVRDPEDTPVAAGQRV